jgi:hypothetical protein
MFAWDGYFNASAEPDASTPVWTKTGVDHVTASANTLVFANCGTDQCYYERTFTLRDDSFFLLDFKAKVETGLVTRQVCSFNIVNLFNQFVVLDIVDGKIFVNRTDETVEWFEDEIAYDTTSDYVHFQIKFLYTGEYYVFIENQLFVTGKSTYQTPFYTANRVFFGKVSTTSENHEFFIDEVKYATVSDIGDVSSTFAVEVDKTGNEPIIAIEAQLDSSVVKESFDSHTNFTAYGSADTLSTDIVTKEQGAGAVKFNKATSSALVNDVVYDGVALPGSSTPSWTVVGTESASVGSGTLTIADCGIDQCIYSKTITPLVDGESYWLKARVFVDGGAGSNEKHCIRLGSSKEVVVTLYWSRLYISGTTELDYSANLSSDFVIIIIRVKYDGTYYVYLNDTLIRTGAGHDLASPAVSFGKSKTGVAPAGPVPFFIDYIEYSKLKDSIYSSLNMYNGAYSGLTRTNHLQLTDFNRGRTSFYIPAVDLAKVSKLHVVLDESTDLSKYSHYEKTTGLVAGWNHFDYTLASPDNVVGTPTRDDILRSFYYYEFSQSSDTSTGLIIDNNKYFYFADDTARWAKTDILGYTNNHFWEGRVLSFGAVERSLSERRGLFDIGGLSIVLANTDKNFLTKYNKYGRAPGFKNKTISVKLGYRNIPYSQWEKIYEGVIEEIGIAGRCFTIDVADYTKMYFDRVPKNLLDPVDFTAIDEGDKYTPAPIIYGAISATGGALPTIYVGEHVHTKHYYIIAGHYCKSGTCELYVDEQLFASGGTLLYGEGVDEVAIAVSFVVDYDYTINGKNYCVIVVDEIDNPDYDPGTEGSLEHINPFDGRDITVNISGKTIDGTSAGTLLTDVVDSFYDFLTVENLVPVALIDTVSFAATKVILNQRNQIMAGAVVADKSTEDVIEEICVSHNIDFYFTKEGKFAISTFNPAKSDVTTKIVTDESDILQSSFKINPGVSILVNRIRFRYDYNYVKETWEGSNKSERQESIDKAGQIHDWPNGYYDFYWARTYTPCNNVISKQLDKFSNGRFTVEMDLPLSIYDKDLTDKVKVSNAEAPPSLDSGANADPGWTEHLCVIRRMSLDLDNLKANVSMENVQDLAQACFYFGDRDTYTPLWVNASTEEKLHGYLCDRSTGQFSNNDAGIKLC